MLEKKQITILYRTKGEIMKNEAASELGKQSWKKRVEKLGEDEARKQMKERIKKRWEQYRKENETAS